MKIQPVKKKDLFRDIQINYNNIPEERIFVQIELLGRMFIFIE